MTPAERRVMEDRRAAIREDLGFPEMRCPGCDEVQEHVHLCATCRGER